MLHRHTVNGIQFLYNAHEGCFDLCEQTNSLTFMSVNEGMCMRNCVQKLNGMLPVLTRRLGDCTYTQEKQRFDEYRESKGYADPMRF